MADKIDQLKFGSTSYDIDLPPDATPSIASLTATTISVQSGSGSNIGTCYIGVDTSGTYNEAYINFTNMGVVGGTKLSGDGFEFSGLATYTLNFPSLSANATFATQEWVTGKGYTTNTGTVTSITVKTGTGLTGGSNTAVTTSGTWTIGIDSGYKLPTTTEWNNKSGKVYHHLLHLRINYQVFSYEFYSTSNTSTTAATLVSKLNLNPSAVLASEYVTGDMVHIYSSSYVKSSGTVSISSGDWYSKNASNYMIRSSANGYQITIDSESIAEA